MSGGRILLADAYPLFLDHLEKLLGGAYEVVGRVTDGGALLDAMHSLAPQVVLLDVSLPPSGGFEVAKQLKAIAPASKLIFLSVHDDPRYLDKARQVGGQGLLLKQYPAAIAPYIDSVLDGHEADGTVSGV